jgi:3-oxoacyl-[acyl-carrier protein] reductase
VPQVLVFGGTGALGSEICRHMAEVGWTVTVASRSQKGDGFIDTSLSRWEENCSPQGHFDAVVWAQGVNMGAGALDVSLDDIRLAIETNVIFIVDSIQRLYRSKSLTPHARGVILSSIWQESARDKKLAYVVSKSALSGLIPALALDLASEGFSVNAVLPGVIDTPMTRAQLSTEQLARVKAATPGNALALPNDVARAATWLASVDSIGINGQSITVDNGWSIKRDV